MSDFGKLINASDLIGWIMEAYPDWCVGDVRSIVDHVEDMDAAQPERLTDDDFETIRIHLNAYKEKLCNQQRWKEAEEYQRIIDRFMAFASAQKERKKGHWVEIGDEPYDEWECDVCGFVIDGSGCIDPEEYRDVYRFCPNCGAKMRGGDAK